MAYVRENNMNIGSNNKDKRIPMITLSVDYLWKKEETRRKMNV